MKIKVGSFVKCKQNHLGIGKVKDITEQTVTIEYFKSIVDNKTIEVPIQSVTPVLIEKQTRCYFYNTAKERWVMGRIIRKDGTEYEVDFPDTYSAYIDESELFVRCNVPIEDPSDVLKFKGHETAFYHARRSLFVKTLLEQRAVARGMTGLVSSNIHLFKHQVEVVRRVLEDPIPRYLLADEVGLGKTIEAGVIMRQYMLDYPNEKILIIVPPYLLDQWKKEMDEKFKFDYFDDQILWMTADQLDRLTTLSGSFGMVVIDEAHEIAAKAFHADAKLRKQFDVLARVVHKSEGLLLLSATPVLNNEKEFLAMLYLLDPDYYQLTDIDSFKERVAKRQEVGRFLLSFREDSSAFLLKRNVGKLFSYFPNDFIIRNLAEKLQNVLASDKDLEDKRKDLIRRIRIHLSDTYRLHRRLLRNRRESVTDILSFSRDQQDHRPAVQSEYDLDERTASLEQLLDEWRNEAWASERTLWEEEGRESTELMKIFYILFEALGTSPSFFAKVVQSRLNQLVDADLHTEQKLSHLELVTKTPFFEGEEQLLEQMLNAIKDPSEDGDRVQLLAEIIQHQKRKTPAGKIVVFTGYTTVCKEIIQALQTRFGEESVCGYFDGLPEEQVVEEVSRFKEDPKSTILVCDATGEVGRNLQFADILIHFDLPLSPNRLEQRIGRFDRIGRDKPFTSFVLAGPDDESSLHDAWVQFLNDGLKIFTTSIASLQFYIERKMVSVFKQFYIEGIPGILQTLSSIGEEIENEKVQIGEQNALDEMETNNPEANKFYDSLIKYEQEFAEIDNGLDPWITSALRFRRERTGSSSLTFKYVPKRDMTLVPLRFLYQLASYMSQPGSYDRDEAIYQSGCSLFRIGDPLLDFLEKYIYWDDRGQAFAIWRHIPEMDDREGSEWIGFSLHYIVEGDTKPAEKVLKKYKNDQMNTKALKRMMDHYFPPAYEVIHLDMNGNKEEDPTVLGYLTKEFSKKENGGSDTNLTKNRLGWIDQVIPSAFWKETVESVRETSKILLKNSSELKELCKEKGEMAQAQLELKVTQLKLRINQEIQLAGEHKLNFKNDIEFENDLKDAILEGIHSPKMKLDSIGMIVLSGRNLTMR